MTKQSPSVSVIEALKEKTARLRWYFGILGDRGDLVNQNVEMLSTDGESALVVQLSRYAGETARTFNSVLQRYVQSTGNGMDGTHGRHAVQIVAVELM